jgi:isocitrate dehydrogenase
MGRAPERLRKWNIDPSTDTRIRVPGYTRQPAKKTLVGADLFVDWVGEPMDAGVIGGDLERLTKEAGGELKLKMITNRGVKVYPDGFPETFLTDHWRCRFVHPETVPAGEQTDYRPVVHTDVTHLMNTLTANGYEVIKTENLYLFDGERGFSLGQGE